MVRIFILLVSATCAMVVTPLHQAEAQSSDPVIEVENQDVLLHTETEIERAYRAVKRDDAYQYKLAEPIPRKPPSAFSRALGRFLAAIGRILFPLLKIIFYIGIGVLVVAAAYLIGRAIYETRFARPAVKKAEDPEVPLYQPAEAQARILLEEVDKLAAEGRYGEAVHTLLFRSIQDIDRNRPNVVRRSLTAREIGSLSVLTPDARKAFSTIAGVSELAHFGGVLVNQAGFKTARSAYADLTGQTTPTRKARR